MHLVKNEASPNSKLGPTAVPYIRKKFSDSHISRLKSHLAQKFCLNLDVTFSNTNFCLHSMKWIRNQVNEVYLQWICLCAQIPGQWHSKTKEFSGNDMNHCTYSVNCSCMMQNFLIVDFLSMQSLRADYTIHYCSMWIHQPLVVGHIVRGLHILHD
jgi:hypothetical protein